MKVIASGFMGLMYIVFLGIWIYFILLVKRFVEAVERISDKLNR